jgi:hypothetical protein
LKRLIVVVMALSFAGPWATAQTSKAAARAALLKTDVDWAATVGTAAGAARPGRVV